MGKRFRDSAECSGLAQLVQVREIWLSSEDTGAYGRDIGTDLPELLRGLVDILPSDGRTMLRYWILTAYV